MTVNQELNLVERADGLSQKHISFSYKSTVVGLRILGGFTITTYRTTDRRKIGSRKEKNCHIDPQNI